MFSVLFLAYQKSLAASASMKKPPHHGSSTLFISPLQWNINSFCLLATTSHHCHPLQCLVIAQCTSHYPPEVSLLLGYIPGCVSVFGFVQRSRVHSRMLPMLQTLESADFCQSAKYTGFVLTAYETSPSSLYHESPSSGPILGIQNSVTRCFQGAKGFWTRFCNDATEDSWCYNIYWQKPTLKGKSYNKHSELHCALISSI